MDTSRKNTSGMRRTRVAIVAFAVIALAIIILAGCGNEIEKSDFRGGTGSSGVSGTVYDRDNTGSLHLLYIRDAAGTEYSLRVRLGPYRRCHDGDAYQACAWAKGARS